MEPGGAQLSALRLSAALRAHGVRTRFLAGDASAAGLALAREHGYAVEAFGHGTGLQWSPSEAFAEWLSPRLADADVVHAHMFGAWWAAALAAPERVPLVASEHNCIAWPGENHDDAARARAARLARMFAHGPAAMAWAQDIGIPAERLEAGESPVAGFGDGPMPGLAEPRITFTGRLMADKAPDVLVEALAHMPDPPATYVLGEGILGAALRERAQALGLGAVVRFPGWQAQPGRWVSGASVHCVPSREEAWSQSAVIAMALGVPVIGTDVEGLPDTLGQGRGLLVAPEDPEGLAAVLGAVLRGERTTDVAAARAYALRFVPARIAARYAAVYRDVLAGEPEPLPA